MKNWIILILAVTCIALWFVPHGVKKDDGAVEPDVKQLVDTEVKRVNKKIDEKGFEHAVIAEVENVVNNTSQVSDSVKRELDSITHLLGIKDNQLRQYISYSATLQDSLLKATKDKNSKSFSFSDEWTKITYVPSDTNDGYFDFKYNAQINYSEYYKRDWFLGKKKGYIDFWVSDPRATIMGVKRVKIEPKQDRVRFNAGGAAIYYNGLHTGFNGELSIGSRYRFGAGYLYDFNSEEWKPMLSTRFIMIDF